MQRVLVKREGGVAEVRLNRAEKLNALDAAMFDALMETGKQLAGDPSVRAVVLCGEGRAFCAGLDFASFMNLAGSDGPRRNLLDRDPGDIANFAQQAAWVWRALPVPVIAALHGVAFGGGLQIALAADIRIARPDAQLSVMEIKWGLVPDMSGTQTLRHLVRLDVAKELTYTGRVVAGSEAAELGLVTRLSDDPLRDAHAVAQEIASKSPDAIRAGKQLLEQAYLGSLAEGLLLEEKLQKSVIGRANQMEAVQANLTKRPAQFNDPE